MTVKRHYEKAFPEILLPLAEIFASAGGRTFSFWILGKFFEFTKIYSSENSKYSYSNILLILIKLLGKNDLLGVIWYLYLKIGRSQKLIFIDNNDK